MKFKSIFLMFNAAMLLFLGIVILLPPLVLESTFSLTFFRINWPYIVFLVVLIGCFNAFYIYNRRLYTLLEKEDWPVLVRYLENEVIRKGRYSSGKVRLLANSYLVLSDSAAVMSLENKTAVARPALVDANVMIFGAARILGRDISGAVRFFGIRKGTVKAEYRDWVSWYHGFALLLNLQNEEAGVEFSLLARESADPVITGLSSYFLSEILARRIRGKGPEYRETADLGKERALKVLSEAKNWNHQCSRLSSEIHAAAISKYLEETGKWLYK